MKEWIRKEINKEIIKALEEYVSCKPMAGLLHMNNEAIRMHWAIGYMAPSPETQLPTAAEEIILDCQ
jgi:hypothetical protein